MQHLPQQETRQPVPHEPQSMQPQQTLSKQLPLPPTQLQRTHPQIERHPPTQLSQTQPKHARPSDQSQKKQPPPQQGETKQPPSQARPYPRPPLASSRKPVPAKEKPKVLAGKTSLSQINSKRKPKTVPVAGQDDAADSGLLFNAATSLAAFESLANETSDDWSKIARATGMMEHEVEAEILDTLANKLVRGSSSAAYKDEANVGQGTTRQLPSSPSPNRAGTKRGATSLLSTRTSKRLAAAKPTKELPARRSPLLQRTRSASKHQQGSSTNDHIPGIGSPDVNSAMFAGGTDTLDAWDLQGDESRRNAFERTAFGLERDQR